MFGPYRHRGDAKYANTLEPYRKGCTDWHAKGGRHQWNFSSSWNGNNRKILPFIDHGHGLARAGWRCFHCGKMVWEESNLSYAMGFATAWGIPVLDIITRFVKRPNLLLEYEAVMRRASDRFREYGNYHSKKDAPDLDKAERNFEMMRAIDKVMMGPGENNNG